MIHTNILFLYKFIIHSCNKLCNVVMPFKSVKIKNKKNNKIVLLLLNLSYCIGYIFKYNINESTFIEFKNNKRNITTIINPTNTGDLFDQIKKMEINSNNKYDRFKIDNPPKIIIKSIKCGDIDITKILKTIVHGDNDISIEDLLYFSNNQNEISDELIKIKFFDSFVEKTLEYEYNDVKHCNITFLKNLCMR